jgi:Invasin, domain 3
MNQLLKQYSSYYNVPVQQLTSTQIAQLLAQQAAWAANTQVSGYIQGNQVTITNGGAAANVPLTGITTVGSTYGGTQSGWTSAAAGISTYTAQSTWPAPGVTVTMKPGSIVANGTSISTATATVTAGANPVSGDAVTFSSSDSAEKISPVTDNKNGTYTATITSSNTAHQVTITATDSSVSPSVSGHATVTQTAAAPSNLQAPSISGTATVGRALKATPGTWSGTSPIVYAYQWQRCNPGCSAIAGSRSSSYTLIRTDRGARVRVSVTASNTRGSAQAYSPQFGPVG